MELSKKFYIEFVHKNSDAENYDMQSKWFPTKKKALDWFKDSFDFVDNDVIVFVMTAKFKDEDNYEIIKSERVRH